MLYMTPALAIFIAKFLTQKLASPGLKFISAAIFIMTIAVYFLGIAINRNSYTLDEMFSRNQYKFSEDDLIAVGSLQIHPYLLEANVNRPVLRMCINMGNEAETRQETWNLLNWELFNPHPDKSFCLLTKEDYYSYTFKPYIQKTLRVVGSAYVPIKPDIKNVYLSVLKRDKALFWDSFRRKAVFITNKESVK